MGFLEAKQTLDTKKIRSTDQDIKSLLEALNWRMHETNRLLSILVEQGNQQQR